MVKRKKKGDAGEAGLYYTRSQVLRKLQVTLKSFRKLCILKGIYPREPRNRKKAQHGATDRRTLYNKKDINFLMQEPLLWKIWDYKVYCRKKARAKAFKDRDMFQRVADNKPLFKLDHIVKERYPTFIDALRDLDDCLTMCFLFSHFPIIPTVPPTLSRLCRRLTVEFLHFCIETRALRKVFVSIKGYYYQADVKGQIVTWIIPHHFGYQPQQKSEVDFSVMTEFVQFYSTLLGFVNFRLYHAQNIFYPPQIPGCQATELEKELVDESLYVSDRIAALNHSLSKSDSNANTSEEAEASIDEFPVSEDPHEMDAQRKEIETIGRLKSLFKGFRFFLGREVPREPLVFVIRCLGGEVSWEKLHFVGATYDDNDETITHQVCDRPTYDKQYMSRYYIQPQWVFDCCNARKLLKVEDYFPGVVLPPHISPFVTERDGDYVPPERRKLMQIAEGKTEADSLRKEAAKDKEESDETESDDEEDEEEVIPEQENEEDTGVKKTKKKKTDKPMQEEDEDEQLTEKERKLKQMSVDLGEPEKMHKWILFSKENKERTGLNKMMIKNKHKRLYRSMVQHRQRRQKEAKLLSKKRNEIEKKEVEGAKEEKKKRRKQQFDQFVVTESI